MVLILLAVLAGVVAALLTAAARGPDTNTHERGVDIKAPPERSPISSGKGATVQWTGSGSTGSGRMEITESVPPSRVTVVADFLKPFAAHNINDFTLERRGDSTHVTWSWRGQNVFVLRVVSLFRSADTLMGSHFESGLQALKRRAESLQ
jgi:hypothetical protein